MKKFLLFLFAPIIELLTASDKLQITKYRLNDLKIRLNQLTDCFCSCSGYKSEDLELFENDFKKTSCKVCLLVFISILLIASLIVIALFYRTKTITIVTFVGSALVSLITYYLLKKSLIDYSVKKLKHIKQSLQNLCNPNRMYERLGIDILCIEIGENLIPLADVDQEGQLIPSLLSLTQKLTDKYGYIIPFSKIRENINFKQNEYVISVRGEHVAKGTVYNDKILINAKDIEEDISKLETIKFDSDFLEDLQNWYWVNKTDAEKFDDIQKLNPEKVIIMHLEKVVMDYVEYIFSYTDVLKREVLIQAQYNDDFDNKYDIAILYNRPLWWYIFVNLLKERISIKDVCFIAEKITFYSSKTNDWDEILNNIKKDIKNLKNNLKG